jgi:NAD(P)-dependent dehydrogenase (short-subunit alcohol dehydrogenase family)
VQSGKIVSLPNGSTPPYSACTHGHAIRERCGSDGGECFCIIETSGSVAGVTVASAVVAFLASDDAKWITGHTLPVDGGYCAQ